MKTIKKIFLLVILSIVMSSCQKYLDIKRSSSQSFIETAANCQQILDNYDEMNTRYPSDGQNSSDDYYVSTDNFPGDFTAEKQFIYTWNSTLAIRSGADPQWLRVYATIYHANLVLEALNLDKVKKSADVATINNLKGSALFFRAFALWNVAQLYAKPYSSTATTDPGVPARTSPDVNDDFGRGTVKETYNRITQDLKDAIDLLNPNFSDKPTRPNKAAAYAMLARVYLSMEDYEQALTNANACLQLNHGLLDYNTLTAGETPFTRFNNEVLFHSTLLDEYELNGSVPLLYPSIAKISLDLYQTFDNNDLRKTLFFNANGYEDDNDNFIPDGTYKFTGNYEPSSRLFNGLAVDEMYLTRAECYARTGNIPFAMKDLNDLLKTRWKNTVVYPMVSASTIDEALSKILLERRKELVMRGQRWTDLRRLNKDPKFKTDVVRKQNGTGAVFATLHANDLRYTLLIPQEVIDKGKMQQNPR